MIVHDGPRQSMIVHYSPCQPDRDCTPFSACFDVFPNTVGYWIIYSGTPCAYNKHLMKRNHGQCIVELLSFIATNGSFSISKINPDHEKINNFSCTEKAKANTQTNSSSKLGWNRPNNVCNYPSEYFYLSSHTRSRACLESRASHRTSWSKYAPMRLALSYLSLFW